MNAPDIAARRRRVLGPTYSLFYDEPIHPVRGEGVWLIDASGERFLDAYNNVVSVGHCHPHVVAALSRQAARLNTHTRYLDETVLNLAERLLATAPAHLSHALFTCTGSEANDLAVRIAEFASGRSGVIVTSFAYHGNSHATAALSPATGGARVLGRNRAVAAPDTFREGGAAAAAFLTNLRATLADMAAKGQPAAALILDSSFSSDGVFFPEPSQLAAIADVVHAAGALFIADEVQSGFGRLGEGMWGFSRYGAAPDIVSMGKPMGDGHPVAGLMLRPELVEGFGASEGYFNTFGGNPVSAAVALAVLDVIEAEGLITHASEVGRYLEGELNTLARRRTVIGDVRVRGLYCGVEIAESEGSGSARQKTRTLVNAMRRRGVLIGACGPHGNVLKIRPPLPFSASDVDRLTQTLDAAIGDLGG
jgi:4-aminobutyrate aminotransferase-like enzyme